jgi:hypothetical protein
MAASADVSVARTYAGGSTVTSTSTVRNVTVGGLMRISSVAATATVAAHGRPGTNPVAYRCTVTGLEVTLPQGDTLPAGLPSSIPSASCNDPRVVALTDAVNTLFTGTLRVEFLPAFSAADHPVGGAAALVQRQSPRGYFSEVAISDLDQAQNTILMNDTSIEQPALVVTVYLDSSQMRNRAVACFAAVAATARYGIFPLENGDTGGPGDVGGGGGLDAGTFATPPSTDEGGGSPPRVPVVDTAPPAPLGTAGWSAVPAAVIDGVRFLWAHPRLIPPLLATWLLFLGPAYLLSRRRTLLRAT